MTDTAQIFQFPSAPEAPREKRGAQLEDGYVRTANAIVEALCKAPLTSREARVVRAVERATFGWDRSSARLSQSVLAKMTGLTTKRCSETVNGLLAKKVLRRDGGSQAPIGINTRISEWDFSAQKSRVSPKRKPDPTWGLRPQNGDEKRPQDGDTNTDTTDTLEPKGSRKSSKKSSPKKWGDPVDHELAEQMFFAISADLTNPKRPNMSSWANEFRLMRTRDERTVEQIRFLITWTAQHQFWSGVILSPAKLRAKWDQLEIQVKKLKESRHENRISAGNRRAEQDRVAASLADPYDTSWAEGLFDEGGTQGGDSGAGEPGVYSDGGDFSEDLADVVLDERDASTGQAGAGIFDGEVVITADDGIARYGH